MGLLVLVSPDTMAVAHAQQSHLPIVGRLFLHGGGELRAGPVLEWDDELTYATTVGPRLRVGLHHILTNRLSMNAEAALGVTYFRDHPIAPGGAAESRPSLDWSATVLARYFPVGPRRSWTYAGGVHYRDVRLADGSLLQFGIEGRLGYAVWTGDERFLIVELGIHAPLIEGLSISQSFLDPEREPLPQSWIYPTATLGVQWTF